MGYELHVRLRERTEDRDVALARDAFRKAVRERDLHGGSQEDVDEAMRALAKAKRSYFWFSVGQILLAREMMLRLGMMYPEPQLVVPWPIRSDFGQPDQEDMFVERQRAYQDAIAQALEAEGSKPGIPEHKLSSPQGWIVSGRECATSVEQYRLNLDPEEELPSWWGAWISFLDYASTRGGFRVA